MEANTTSDSQSVRASATSREQRDGAEFTGGYGKKTGDSDLLFVEGQLPENGDRIASDEPPVHQLERCLGNLDTQLERHGKETSDVLQLTLYLTGMDAYEEVNEAYEQYFDETYPGKYDPRRPRTPRRCGSSHRHHRGYRVTLLSDVFVTTVSEIVGNQSTYPGRRLCHQVMGETRFR